jgi:hypothetical protein
MDLTTPQSLTEEELGLRRFKLQQMAGSEAASGPTEKEAFVLRRFKLLQEVRSTPVASWKIWGILLLPLSALGGWSFYQGCGFISSGRPQLGMACMLIGVLAAMAVVFLGYVLPLQRRMKVIAQLIEDEIRPR